MKKTLIITSIAIAMYGLISMIGLVTQPSILDILYQSHNSSGIVQFDSIHVTVSIDDSIYFNGKQNLGYIFPEKHIPLQLKTGWHKISIQTPTLNLKQEDSFFTFLRSHLVIWIYEQDGEKDITFHNHLKNYYY